MDTAAHITAQSTQVAVSIPDQVKVEGILIILQALKVLTEEPEIAGEAEGPEGHNREDKKAGL